MRESGYVALIAMLVIGAVASTIAGSLLLLGLGSSRSSFAEERSNHAKALANACSEEALQQIRDNTNYSASNVTITLGQGSCTYSVIVNAGENRTINSSGTVGSITRKVKVTVTAINPKIIVSPWEEVSDF